MWHPFHRHETARRLARRHASRLASRVCGQHRRTLLTGFSAAALAVLSIVATTGEAFGASYTLRRGVIGGGGGFVESSSITLRGTIGQPVVGLVQSGSYSLFSGFWSLDPGAVVSVDPPIVAVPDGFVLLGNRPNPFDAATRIEFGVPRGGGSLRLRVYDVRGRLIRTLVDGPSDPGYRSITWNGRDDAGRPVSAGVYVYQLESAGGVQSRKLVRLE